MPEAAPAPKKDDTLRMLAILGFVGVGGYLAYRYWYLPAKLQDDIRAAMAARGQPGGNPLAVLGGDVCAAYGASYGIPPQASMGICGQLGQAAAQVVQMLPGLVDQTGQAAGNTLTYLGGGAGNLLSSVGAGAGSGVASLSAGVASGAVSLGTAPMKIIEGYTGPIYGGAKQVIGDTTKAIGSVGKSVSRVFSSIF